MNAQSAFTPTRQVTLVVPFPPGGGTDALGRIVVERLSAVWKQPVIVDNRAGAQGNVGTAWAAKAPADGHTLVLAHQGVFTVNPHLYKESALDPLRDFKPITRGTQQPFVLVAHPSLPAQSLRELIALAKSQPGKLSYGSSASGPQLAGEMFKAATQVDMLHVAYKGAGPAVVDLLAGHIPLMVANPASVAPHVRTGKLKALVLFGKDPLDVLPGTPTAEQAGYPTLGEMPEWYGFAVPAATPAELLQPPRPPGLLVVAREAGGRRRRARALVLLREHGRALLARGPTTLLLALLLGRRHRSVLGQR
ncbi:MAG: Bug family tripartite tricarboxylate transporter substrate binding protein, partial [Hylemonella sp.]